MIDLYTANTFNGQRATIMLEEIELDHRVHHLALRKGEQRQPDFLKLNPSGRIPVLVEREYCDSTPFVLTQSVAIVQYLAERSGQLLPDSLAERARVYEWMQFHATDISSALFSAFYLHRLIKPAQKQAADLLRLRVHDFYRHFDRRLRKHEFLAGSQYSIADIITLPAVIAQQDKLTEYNHLMRWSQQLQLRPAVQRGLSIPQPELSHEN
ncbi:MAG: glutathione S-transferase family protein [Candidatus Methanofishera endochildressiae]|uniref:Glutathione S-transferase family protein n=1 Tax=Candidatus Methanofishera endochildressiae TaxID=2738884 RepID=A0A7Z0MNS7_9GAMM|nr:glutathione S-transferase family protein [Candidatus Methanofishera endochildressiae]